MYFNCCVGKRRAVLYLAHLETTKRSHKNTMLFLFRRKYGVGKELMQIVTEALSQCIAFRILVVKIRLVFCVNNDLHSSKLQHYIWFKIA